MTPRLTKKCIHEALLDEYQRHQMAYSVTGKQIGMYTLIKYFAKAVYDAQEDR